MKAYSEYKDSGIEWAGNIPAIWITKKLKFFAKICNGKEVGENEVKEGGYPVYGTGGAFKRSSAFMHQKPSVLLGRKGTIDKPQFVQEPFWTVDTVYYTNIFEETNSKFFYYLTKQIPFDLYSYGSAVPSMTKEHLDNIEFPCPTLEEQTAIANFLDHKTAQIDESISKRKQLIELLQEQRKAIINEAVTKGINPKAKMKDSGIEWIGEIPEHWEVKKIKHVGNFINGYAFKSDKFTSKGVRVLKISNIQTMRISWEDESFIDEEYFESLPDFRVNYGDLVFALTRPIISTGIKATLFETCEKTLLNQRNAILRPNKYVNNKWLYFLLLTDSFVQEFDKQIDKTGQQPNISSTKIGNIYFPLPNKDEQTLIINYIEDQKGKIDNEIQSTQKEITLLEEYRQSLITEAVTGKIDVRDYPLN